MPATHRSWLSSAAAARFAVCAYIFVIYAIVPLGRTATDFVTSHLDRRLFGYGTIAIMLEVLLGVVIVFRQSPARRIGLHRSIGCMSQSLY